jgi:hypothetical protein
MERIEPQVIQNVKALLHVSRRSQRQLADHLNMGAGQLSKRLTGHIHLSVDEVELMADFFHVHPFDLFRSHSDFVAWLRANQRVVVDLTMSDLGLSGTGWSRTESDGMTSQQMSLWSDFIDLRDNCSPPMGWNDVTDTSFMHLSSSPAVAA